MDAAAEIDKKSENYSILSSLDYSRGRYSFGNKPSYQGNGRSLPYYVEDFGLIKRTPITEGIDLRFGAEFFNAFNRVVFSRPDTNPYEKGFGAVGGTNNSARQGQLTLRIEF